MRKTYAYDEFTQLILKGKHGIELEIYEPNREIK